MRYERMVNGGIERRAMPHRTGRLALWTEPKYDGRESATRCCVEVGIDPGLGSRARDVGAGASNGRDGRTDGHVYAYQIW